VCQKTAKQSHEKKDNAVFDNHRKQPQKVQPTRFLVN